jgi:hypothetical protein
MRLDITGKMFEGKQVITRTQYDTGFEDWGQSINHIDNIFQGGGGNWFVQHAQMCY